MNATNNASSDQQSIIDGKATAAQLREDITQRVEAFKQKYQATPGLAVVLVGEDPASQVYVRNKGKQTKQVGMASFEYRFDDTVTQQQLLEHIDELNQNSEIHGILVQLPLPNHIDAQAVLMHIDPAKDVDGFHPINAGRLATGQPALVPCTPKGCILLLKQALSGQLAGKHAVIIGRSNIVGKPLISLLLQQDCTVTVAHSKTTDLPAACKQADIVIAAVGRPEMVKQDWIKPGATVIDVGINRIESADGGTKLVGDVDFNGVSQVAAHITPVPGGVGPMTIACLLDNTLIAAENILNDKTL